MHPLANALVVVDVQNDFCPGGSLAVDHGDEVATRIHRFIVDHDDDYKIIVATKDWHPNTMDFDHFSSEPDYVNTWPMHCVAGTHGANFHPNLHAADPSYNRGDVLYNETNPPYVEFDQIFYKGQNSAAYSGFEGIVGGPTGQPSASMTLDNYLKAHGIGHVDVCGLATDYCVAATALDAVQGGYDTSVLTALCAGVARESSVDSIEAMLLQGVHVDGWWG